MSSRPEPSDDPSRAGSRAGEGRKRPGREKGPLEDEEAKRGERDRRERDGERDGSTPREAEGQDDGGSAPESAGASDDPARDAATGPSAPPGQPVRHPVSHAADPTEPVLEILPLGTGLVLIGLGLGLAFVGLRLRRG
ncbi:MAG: hypothetical protein HOZ81_15950 [Streptomyces sp.]|nr:hypothetical protein [Streptomyces sp.]